MENLVLFSSCIIFIYKYMAKTHGNVMLSKYLEVRFRGW